MGNRSAVSGANCGFTVKNRRDGPIATHFQVRQNSRPGVDSIVLELHRSQYAFASPESTALLLVIASLNGVEELFWVYYGLAWVFFGEDKFADAQAHVERAKPHAVNYPYFLTLAMDRRARLRSIAR